MEPDVTMVELSAAQWIAFVSFVIATVAFFVWVANLARRKR